MSDKLVQVTYIYSSLLTSKVSRPLFFAIPGANSFAAAAFILLLLESTGDISFHIVLTLFIVVDQLCFVVFKHLRFQETSWNHVFC